MAARRAKRKPPAIQAPAQARARHHRGSAGGRSRARNPEQHPEASRAQGSPLKMKRFLVVIEKAKRNYSAYSPDLPGCVATGGTKAEVEKNIRAAIRMHFAGLREDGRAVPEARSVAECV